MVRVREKRTARVSTRVMWELMPKRRSVSEKLLTTMWIRRRGDRERASAYLVYLFVHIGLIHGARERMTRRVVSRGLALRVEGETSKSTSVDILKIVSLR